MKIFFIIIVLMFSSSGHASTTVEPERLCRHLQIKGQIFGMDETGQRLAGINVPVNTWSLPHTFVKASLNAGDSKYICRIEARNWRGQWQNSKNPLLMHHEWLVRQDGTIHVKIEQYRTVNEKDGRTNFTDLVAQKEFDLKDFTPVVWISALDASPRMVVHLTPEIVEGVDPIDVGLVPIASDEFLLIDDHNEVLAQRVGGKGDFIAIGTKQGVFVLSLASFSSGEEIGMMAGNAAELRLKEGRKVRLLSTTPLLPVGVQAKVYGKLLDHKNAQPIVTGSDVERFIRESK